MEGLRDVSPHTKILYDARNHTITKTSRHQLSARFSIADEMASPGLSLFVR